VLLCPVGQRRRPARRRCLALVHHRHTHPTHPAPSCRHGQAWPVARGRRLPLLCAGRTWPHHAAGAAPRLSSLFCPLCSSLCRKRRLGCFLLPPLQRAGLEAHVKPFARRDESPGALVASSAALSWEFVCVCVHWGGGGGGAAAAALCLPAKWAASWRPASQPLPAFAACRR
jgi:hypothetical protein